LRVWKKDPIFRYNQKLKSMNTFQLGSIVKISKPELRNNAISNQGGDGKIGKIVDMGVTSCTVSNGMGYFSCTFEQISSFEGKVPFLIENIRIRKK
jgi:hypothetical protein